MAESIVYFWSLNQITSNTKESELLIGNSFYNRNVSDKSDNNKLVVNFLQVHIGFNIKDVTTIIFIFT